MHASHTIEFRPWLGPALVLALSPVLFAATAHASLKVTVKQGNAPAGFTEWTFSGSSTYTEVNPGGTFALVPPLTDIVEWKGDALSDYVKPQAYNNYTPTLISGSIGITVTPPSGPAQSAIITALHVDHDNTGDDFGVGLSGSMAIPLNTNDVVSWSGTGIFAVDFAKLNVGSFSFLNYGETSTTSSQPFGNLPLTISVEVPGPLPVLGTAFAFSCSRQLRRRIQVSRKPPFR